jgi:Tfp pilus assembly protein PilF
MMPGFRKQHLMVSVVAVAACAAAAAVAVGRDATSTAPIADIADADLRAADIALFERRAAEDPWSAADRARLAALYLQRGREGGGLDDYGRAEAAARASLELREDRNGRTRLLLASALLAQHRFAEARVEAERALAAEPAAPSVRALHAEILMELGDYEAAAQAFASLRMERENLAVAPRLARWAELNGRPWEARALLEAARRRARTRLDLPREHVAWFDLRLGDLALRQGDARAAERAFRDGLAIEPNDVRLHAALARVAAARADWHDVLRLIDRIAAAADVATLALAGDAALRSGDVPGAERWYAAAERVAMENAEPFQRQWTQFRLDRSRGVAEILPLLRAEAAARPDVLGLDLLAWGLFLHGDAHEADAVMQRALRLGTRDAALRYHAGRIAQALGRFDAARAHFEAARAIDPQFHPLHADSLRSALQSLPYR